MSLVVQSQQQQGEELPAVVQTAGSDSDSGMGSPAEEMVMETTNSKEDHPDTDDDEDVMVHRKPRCLKALQDSDEEEEAAEGPGAATMPDALELSASSVEDMDTGALGDEDEGQQLKKKKGAQKSRKIARAPVDSEESEPERGAGEVEKEEVKSKKGGKKREKSQRHKEKRDRSSKAVEKLKKNERFAEMSEDTPHPRALNDSGCLLGDTDLFDTGLEEEEEESLDAIRASVKLKAKKHKEPYMDEEQEEEDEEPMERHERVERKAARASKEAMKQLHSESQRLVRESTIGLPYYIPKPKTLDEFFKKRTRPGGSGMALLKSAKYEARIMEATPTPPPPVSVNPPSEPQQQPPVEQDSAAPSLDLSSTHIQIPPQPAATSSPQQEINNQSGEQPASLDAEQVSGPMLFLSESLQESMTADGAEVKASSGCEEEMAISLPGLSQMGTVNDTQAEVGITTSALDQPLPPQTVTVDPTSAKPAAQHTKPKKDKLAMLRELGLEPPPVAKLSADDGDFVHLETNPGVKALQERFFRHKQPVKRPQGERTMQLSIIRKDSTPSGQEELREESVTVTVKDGADEAAAAKPGVKLLSLKQRLQQAMALRRQEERARKAELHRLDNEDCGEEEEEEEMTDESEGEECVDDLLGGDDGEDGDEQDEDDDRGSVVQSIRSPSPVGLKGRCPPPNLNADGTLLLFAGSSCSRTGDCVRRTCASGEDSETKTEEEDSLSLMKDNSHNGSFELLGSTIPSYQPVSHQRSTGRGAFNANPFRSPSPCFFRPSFLGSASKSSGKLSEASLSLPVEDSQDLYAPPSPGADSGPLGGPTQGRFSLEDDTASQLLDADGFLNVGPRAGAPRSHKRQLVLDDMDENAMDGNMGELLGLCSGVFGTASEPAGRAGESSSTPEDELMGLCSGVFPSSTQAGGTGGDRKLRPTQEDELLGLCSGVFPSTQAGGTEDETKNDSTDTQSMDQLLGLCSGKFPSPDASPSRPVSSTAQKASTVDRMKPEEEEDECEFRILSDLDSESDQENEDEKEEAEDGEEQDDDDEVEDEELEAVFEPRPVKKKKMRLTEFLDSEAELSGSGSDDEDDEGGSEYEEEELLDDLPSDEELQDQVNKIHMKQVMDDDKRALRLYQERFLADGDLHSDGPGRARSFRWKNMGDDGFEMSGMGEGEEDEEEEGDVDQAEVQRRKERMEREQWFREQSEQKAKARKGEDLDEDADDENIGEDDSQFMKLAKKVTAKTLQRKEPTVAPQPEMKAPTGNPFQRPLQPMMVRRGSLLNQPRAVLQKLKLASISEGNPLAPRNSGRGFLFQTLSPEKGAAQTSDAPKKQVKKRGPVDALNPAAKRPCRLNNPVGKTSQQAPLRSIFSFLEN